jgi:hypothetical protein
MDHQDRQAIEGLFARLGEVERSSPQRDGEAESLIRGQIAQQPSSPYYMAQTIVVQEQALNAAQARIEELEQQARAPQGGGLFASLFGGGRPQPRPQPGAYRQQHHQAPGQPWGGARPAAGGGFLAGAAQTAMGVAGGMLLGNMIAGAFAGDEANAAEAPAEADTGDVGADEGFDMDTEF